MTTKCKSKNICFFYSFLTMSGVSLVTRARHIVGLQMEGQPPAMEGRCEYIEYTAVDKWQGVVFQFWGWA
jgi:hypothetical protein